VVYRLSRASYAIARRFVTVPHVAMANLIAGRRVVPELIQNEFTVANVVAALAPLLTDGSARAGAMAGLREVRERLHRNAEADGAQEGAVERVAQICVELLTGCAPSLSSNASGFLNARGEPERSREPASTYQA
jgi:lipid-A-disaccharide synthase